LRSNPTSLTTRFVVMVLPFYSEPPPPPVHPSCSRMRRGAFPADHIFRHGRAGNPIHRYGYCLANGASFRLQTASLDALFRRPENRAVRHPPVDGRSRSPKRPRSLDVPSRRFCDVHVFRIGIDCPQLPFNLYAVAIRVNRSGRSAIKFRSYVGGLALLHFG